MNYELWLYGGMGLMVVLGLALLLPPLMKEHVMDVEHDSKHRDALKARLQEAHRELESKRESGLLSEQDFKTLEEDLERQALEETRNLDELPERANGGRLGPAWIVGIMVVVIALPFSFYMVVGSPDLPRLAAAQVVLEGNANKEALEAYVKDNPKDGRAWYLLAHKYVDDNENDKAIEAYKAARSLSPKIAADTQVSTELATLCLLTGGDANFNEAYALYSQVRLKEPNNTQILELLIMSEVATRRYQEAKVDMEKFLEAIGPSHPQYLRQFETYQEIKRRAAVQAGQ